jgi:HD-like signal output (HDOD) protein
MNIQEILNQIDSLPPMPAVAVQLLEATQDPDVDMAQVAGLIERDPAMTTNLLRACNSPYYGLRREVSSIRQATGLLGLKKVVQIAVTVLASRYLTPAQKGYDLDPGELWKSSIAAGIAAELLARECRYPHSSTAYTAGLLQDMGKIVLAEHLGELLPQIRHLTEEQQMSWEDAERQVVGITHPDVGANLLQRWNFPAALVESVRCHHRPSAASLDPMLSHLSHLADALTMTLGMGLGADGLAYALDEESVVALGLDQPGRLDAVLVKLAEQLKQAEDLLRPPSLGH